MRRQVIYKYLGYVLLFNAVFLIIASVISLVFGEDSFFPLVFSAVISTVFGLFPLIFVEKVEDLTFMEGLFISVCGWFITCIVGMLPYLLWGGEFSLANAFFESVSGFTTTGATILVNIEALPKGLLFWRASTHFIGGVGVVIFVLLIMPESSGVKSNIYKMEVSELSILSFKSKAKHIVRIICTVYFSLVILEAITLYLLGMSIFDSICHSFATIATGGFSTKNSSIAYFDSVWIELAVIFFMLLSGINFGLLYMTFTGDKMNIFKSKTVIYFVGITIVGTLIVAFKLYADSVYSWWLALRYASFQVVSLSTTTGFATVDTPAWPVFVRFVLIYFTIQCAMIGSTSGGLKFDRVYLFVLYLKKRLKHILHPQAVYVIKKDGISLSSDIETQTMLFFVLYIFTFFITSMLLTLFGVDATTAVSASAATLGNVGPGFGDVSSLGNYSSLPDVVKYILSINMLLGRLEILNILVLVMLVNERGRSRR